MKDKIIKKLSSDHFSLTDAEVQWLMDNIGNTDPAIRDELVYETLARGIFEGFLTDKQYEYVKNETISENLMFYQIDEKLPATLTRSFATLLNACIIVVDGDKESSYYHLLSDGERNYFFHAATSYLYEEKDMTGCSSIYGWVHAFGHFADYLISTIHHDLYKIEDFTKVLESIYFVFKNLEKSFEFGEERRLALPVAEGLIDGIIPQEMLTNWILKADFPVEENRDYYRIAAFENFLVYIYFRTLDEIELEESLKKVMLSYLKKYTIF